MRIRMSLAAVIGLMGFLTLVASGGVKESRRGSERRRAGLVKLIHQRQAEVDDLDQELVRLRRDVLAARRRLSATSADEARRIRSVEMRAGTTVMVGPGLEVMLADSPGQAGDAADREALVVHDVDLQLVVNSLWASGAEAVAVNSQRLVATSPIRAAGETITVNFRPLAPPYLVRAIAADQKGFEGSPVARRFRRWVDDYGLGFSVKRRSRIQVPAYVGTRQLTAARTGDAPAGTSTDSGVPDAGSHTGGR